ncbi:putative F-box protein [Tanacetum coccineum]
MSDPISEKLVIEIFTRLPPKSLVRFRLVSKSLCSRIATPDFIRLNKIRSCRMPEKVLLTHEIPHKEGYRTFYENFYTLHSEYQLPLSPDHGYDGITPIKFPFPLRSRARVVGSCNGIMCVLHDERYFILWNPSLRRKLTLPEYPLREAYIFATGFAFDRVTEDYKIVTLSINRNNYRTYSFVYTMKTRTWCRISTPVTPSTYETRKGHLVNFYETCKKELINLFRTSEGHLVNGVLHWSVFLTDDDTRSANILHYILTFDVGTHVFGTIELPRQKYSEITTIDGSLAVITYKFVTNKDRYAKIWVRKENNTNPKWVAYFSFRVDSHASIKPFSRKGILLLKYLHKGIEVYNDWTRERSRIVEFSDSSNINDMSWFVESLELLDTGSPYEESDDLLDTGSPYEESDESLDTGSSYEESEASDLETTEL